MLHYLFRLLGTLLAVYGRIQMRLGLEDIDNQVSPMSTHVQWCCHKDCAVCRYHSIITETHSIRFAQSHRTHINVQSSTSYIIIFDST